VILATRPGRNAAPVNEQPLKGAEVLEILDEHDFEMGPSEDEHPVQASAQIVTRIKVYSGFPTQVCCGLGIRNG
jgi:hypothetical protein